MDTQLLSVFHYPKQKIMSTQKTCSFYRAMSISVIVLLPCFITSAQSLDELLKKAAESNPALLARYHEYLAALEKIPQVRSLPDPQLTFSMFASPQGLYMERFMGQQLSEISIMQMFPWAGTRQAAQSEATFMARMKWEAFIEARNNLFHEIRTVWYQLYENEQQLKLLEHEKTMILALEQLALTRYKAGSGIIAQPLKNSTPPADTQANAPQAMSGMNMAGPAAGPAAVSSAGSMTGMPAQTNSLADVLRIQLQLKELDARVIKLQNRHRQLIARLANLINDDMKEPVTTADTLLPPALPIVIPAMRDSIATRHPMIKMSRWEEQAHMAQARMSQLMGRPMIGVGISYMVFRPRMDDAMNMPMGGENMFMPMVTLSLPIYRSKYQSLKNEAGLLQSAAASQVDAAKLQLENELERLLNDWEDNNQTLKLLNEQIELTRHMLALTTTGYEAGTGRMEDILQQRQALLDLKKTQLSTVVSQHILVSALYNLTAISSLN